MTANRFPVRAIETIFLTCVVIGTAYLAFFVSPPFWFLVVPGLVLIMLRVGLPGAKARALTEQLRRQEAISAAALDNMVQGLCMFDGQHRLVICNQRYADLYDLPDRLRIPGTPLLEQLRYEAEAFPDPETYLQLCADERKILSPHSELELPNGRIIDVHRTRFPDGGWVATHEDITERRRASLRIAYLASHDPLTDLPNRAHFQEQLNKSLERAEKGDGFALHSLDLDRFKSVNDTYGHAAGDELLREVAKRLRRTLRESDLVARLGGDEFAIIQFPVTRPEDASRLAAKVVEALGKPYRIHGHDVIIGASVGIALAPLDTTECAELLQKSDLALYRAKTNGRNTYCFFENGMDTHLQLRRVLETELRAAIQKGEFELYYQPILEVQSGAIGSLEALLRWHHPIRGIVEPAEFIPTAEESGLMIPIGEWVLREACRQATEWPEEVGLAVNISPTQFKNHNIVGLVVSALAATKLAPQRLELEVTESLLLYEKDAVLATLNQFRTLGVKIAMNDFGTGYSSLGYLREFPFDRIKIDGSFARDVTTKEDCLAIVHATTTLSHKLGIRTTAEGVETAEQFAVLRGEGCTEIQGFYVCPPLRAQQVLETLGRYPRSRVSSLQRKAS